MDLIPRLPGETTEDYITRLNQMLAELTPKTESKPDKKVVKNVNRRKAADIIRKGNREGEGLEAVSNGRGDTSTFAPDDVTLKGTGRHVTKVHYTEDDYDDLIEPMASVDSYDTWWNEYGNKRATALADEAFEPIIEELDRKIKANPDNNKKFVEKKEKVLNVDIPKFITKHKDVMQNVFKQENPTAARQAKEERQDQSELNTAANTLLTVNEVNNLAPGEIPRKKDKYDDGRFTGSAAYNYVRKLGENGEKFLKKLPELEKATGKSQEELLNSYVRALTSKGKGRMTPDDWAELRDSSDEKFVVYPSAKEARAGKIIVHRGNDQVYTLDGPKEIQEFIDTIPLHDVVVAGENMSTDYWKDAFRAMWSNGPNQYLNREFVPVKIPRDSQKKLLERYANGEDMSKFVTFEDTTVAKDILQKIKNNRDLIASYDNAIRALLRDDDHIKESMAKEAKWRTDIERIAAENKKLESELPVKLPWEERLLNMLGIHNEVFRSDFLNMPDEDKRDYVKARLIVSGSGVSEDTYHDFKARLDSALTKLKGDEAEAANRGMEKIEPLFEQLRDSDVGNDKQTWALKFRDFDRNIHELAEKDPDVKTLLPLMKYTADKKEYVMPEQDSPDKDVPLEELAGKAQVKVTPGANIYADQSLKDVAQNITEMRARGLTEKQQELIKHFHNPTAWKDAGRQTRLRDYAAVNEKQRVRDINADRDSDEAYFSDTGDVAKRQEELNKNKARREALEEQENIQAANEVSKYLEDAKKNETANSILAALAPTHDLAQRVNEEKRFTDAKKEYDEKNMTDHQKQLKEVMDKHDAEQSSEKKSSRPWGKRTPDIFNDAARGSAEEVDTKDTLKTQSTYQNAGQYYRNKQAGQRYSDMDKEYKESDEGKKETSIKQSLKKAEAKKAKLDAKKEAKKEAKLADPETTKNIVNSLNNSRFGGR